MRAVHRRKREWVKERVCGMFEKKNYQVQLLEDEPVGSFRNAQRANIYIYKNARTLLGLRYSRALIERYGGPW